MILRELLAEYSMTTLTAFAQRAQLSMSHAWNLWHGRATLGLNLAKRIAQQTGIPLARLIEVEPTPPTPYRGKGGPQRPPAHARSRQSSKSHPSPPPEGAVMTIPDYDTDFYAWTQAQAAAIRAKAWAALDIEHLAEEIESLGHSDRESIENRLQTLLTHLLKWRYDPATEPRRGWRITIRNARKGIAKKAQASLKYYPEQYLAEAYGDAREDAADETDLPLAMFPEVCPWPIEQVLAADFWPAA